MLQQLLTYAAGALPVILGLIILYQRAKILVLRGLVSATAESNVRLADEVKKVNDRMLEMEQREANFMKRPVNVFAGPGTVEAIVSALAPILAAAVVAEISRDADIAKRKPN